jgi:acyl-CoA synthetase (AMP-forming)/AMP-acid ligase II
MRGHGRVAGRRVEDVFRVRGTSLPAPLIVPGAVLELHERVDSAGQVVVGLDESQARAAITAFIAEHRLDSVAVAFLWSFGERVRAVAVLRPGETLALEELRAWAGPRLADYKQPADLVLTGELPRNANAKVMKKQLAGGPG